MSNLAGTELLGDRRQDQVTFCQGGDAAANGIWTNLPRPGRPPQYSGRLAKREPGRLLSASSTRFRLPAPPATIRRSVLSRSARKPKCVRS
jgi:hypothetical protein